jgi:hypothetical protein
MYILIIIYTVCTCEPLFHRKLKKKSGLNWVNNTITCPALGVEWIFCQIF